MMDKRTEELFVAYEAGLDYGLYLAELERMSEGFYDAVLCASQSPRMCLPTAPARRRQDRSKEWQEAMGAGQGKFLNLLVKGLE